LDRQTRFLAIGSLLRDAYGGLIVQTHVEEAHTMWEFTTTVTGSEPDGDARHIVRTHVEGNFPGGVADLTYRFTLTGDQIADLTIVP
jgi:hypothetical protein